MKTALSLFVAASLFVGLTSSAFAYSENYIYKKYNGSYFFVATYAETVESTAKQEIQITNMLKVNGVGYDANDCFAYNATTCKTPELANSSYYSNTSYSSFSSHYIWGTAPGLERKDLINKVLV